jgi:hypothetical protein
MALMPHVPEPRQVGLQHHPASHIKEDGVKVTISLSKKSVDFFKAHAARSKVPYQRMIRSLLDTYADHHSNRPLTKRSTGRASKNTRRSA